MDNREEAISLLDAAINLLEEASRSSATEYAQTCALAEQAHALLDVAVALFRREVNHLER